MSNDKNQFERLFKLWAVVAKLVLDGKRSATKVADLLQAIVDEVQTKFELYTIPGQSSQGEKTGEDIENCLTYSGLMDRCLSKDDDIIKGWLNDPYSYPGEFKGKCIILWKSQTGDGDGRQVAYLVWNYEQVLIGTAWLTEGFGENSPALLKPPVKA